MPQFVHLHVHTQYSILDGQASVQRLVDKAMADGQPGIAVTDHGDMFGIKEFYNYVQKVKGKCKDKAAEAEARIAALRDGTETCADPAAEIAKCERQLEECRRKLAFKPIIGCEVYVARRRLHDKEGKPDQSGYHLILLAKNLKGYHNLIKIVSKAWTEGFYMRPRTDRTEIEKYHEGLICCSACLAGEVPRAITANDLEKAEESIRWHKKVFGDDYYLELQLHKATVERANHEAYPMQLHVNKHLRELAAKHNVRMVCTNDVHFVDEDNAEAHDRLICLSTGKDLDDPKRMLYSKQEWLKTTAEMAAIFGQTDPEAMSTTVDICNQIECYSIDHAPIMPNFEIPEEFGTEAEYRARLTEKDLFDEFTRDENGNVVMSEEEGLKKIQKLGGYDKLYRIKFEADYLAKLTMDGGVSCAAGRKSLGCTIDNIVICDSDEAQLLSRLEYADPSRTLCIVGKRPDFQTLIIQSRAHMLITGGGRPSDYHIVKAEKNGVCILTALQNTYAIMKLFDSQFSSARLADEDAPVSEWMQAPNYLYRNDYVADWQRYYDEQFPGMRSFPVVDEELHLCGGIDIPRTFAAGHTQKLSTLVSQDARLLTVDAQSSVREAARKMMLSGSSFAAVLRDDKMEGVFYASDLIRYFMYLGTESMSDYASFLVPAPEYSNEDRRVYELRVPEAELANMDILPTALMLVAADKHLAQQGSLDCTLSSSSFFYPEQITQVGGLMLCTALTSNGKAGFSVEAEVYTETATFAKAMLIFTER